MSDELTAHLMSLRIDRSAKSRSRGWPRLFLGLSVAGALAFAAVVAKPHVEAALFQTAVKATEIATVSPAQASIELTAAGYVQADRVSRIAPKVPGRVSSVHVRQGDRVEAGQLLVELDAADDQASIAAARSRVAAALAEARSADARAAVARSELEEAKQRASRERRLADRGVTAAAAAEDLEARVASLARSVEAAQAQARAAEASARALGAEVSVLMTGLANLKLVAPRAGTVINKPPEVGEYIGPQPPGVTMDMGGIRVADLSALVVEADIPEARLSAVREGRPAEIVLDAYPNRRLPGQVRQITPEVDRAKATVLVRVAFSDDTRGVLPDMSARVSFLAQTIAAADLAVPPKTVVPRSAVAERSGTKVVFVLREGRVRMVPVTLGPSFGSGFEVLRGPGSGTRVVADPPATLADGQAVKLEG
ncbi:MAG: efflux RND transporter periplasmic adaptor subunit [Polyangiaceae bacterium]|nr:efflux RND transporter periplasmic adaptor subunit [Polyangiaceae bacterium]